MMEEEALKDKQWLFRDALLTRQKRYDEYHKMKEYAREALVYMQRAQQEANVAEQDVQEAQRLYYDAQQAIQQAQEAQLQTEYMKQYVIQEWYEVDQTSQDYMRTKEWTKQMGPVLQEVLQQFLCDEKHALQKAH